MTLYLSPAALATGAAVLAFVVALALAWWLIAFLLRLRSRIEFLRERQDEHRLCLEQLMVEHGKLPFVKLNVGGSDAKWLNKNEARESFRVRRALENLPGPETR